MLALKLFKSTLKTLTITRRLKSHESLFRLALNRRGVTSFPAILGCIFLVRQSAKAVVSCLLLVVHSSWLLTINHQPYYATNPERKARTAAWVRSSAQSLFKMLRTWVLTVPTVMYSFSAICPLLHPATINSRISSSRCVRG